MIKEKIGAHIKALRMAKGYSQDSFALKSGLHRTYIAGIESGKRNVSLENLCKIADALEVSLSDLCNYEAPVHNTILIKINDECFLLKTDSELTDEIKKEIEIIARLAYDPDEPSLDEILAEDNIASIGEASNYDIIIALKTLIERKFGIKITFCPIDFETSIGDTVLFGY